MVSFDRTQHQDALDAIENESTPNVNVLRIYDIAVQMVTDSTLNLTREERAAWTRVGHATKHKILDRMVGGL